MDEDEPTGESRRLPVIPWEEGFKFVEPPGYVPSFADLGLGKTVDEARLPWILDALLVEHPEAERLRAVTADQPGLDVEPQPDGTMVLVKLAATGEAIGLFDRRLLEATENNETPWVRADSPGPPQTNIAEIVAQAILVHPLREKIGELLEAGSKPEMRLMAPPPELETEQDLGEPTVQVFIGEGEDFISIVTFPVFGILGRYVDLPPEPDD